MLKRLGPELGGSGKKTLLITDKIMANHCDPLIEALNEAGCEVDIWDGAEPEPTIDVAIAGSKALEKSDYQLVVGFGGGSAIDTAKAAWILWERPDLSVKEILPKTKLNLRQKARFMAVPTTSGTGSEMNWAIVLTDKESQRKLGIGNDEIIPDIALLVPEFTANMPGELTASSGLDVLGHALDGYTSRQQTDFSDGLCLQAMGMVFEWLPKAYKDGDNMIAREKMQNAAAIAGLGFGNSNTSLSHALGHAIGVTFHMGHGKAIGISLSYSLDYIISNPALPKTADPVEKLSRASTASGIVAGSKKDASKMLIDKIKELEKEVNAPLTLKEAGISKQDFDQKLETLIKVARKDVNMYSCPTACEEDDLKRIFKEMYE
jgi:alcohol dehydrogenase class IV